MTQPNKHDTYTPVTPPTTAQEVALRQDLADLLTAALTRDPPLTQRQLAKQAHMTEWHVSRVIRGRHSSTLRTVARLAEAAGVHVRLVVTGTVEEPLQEGDR